MDRTPSHARSTPPRSETEYYLLEYLSHLYGSGVAPDLAPRLLAIAQRHRTATPPVKRPALGSDDILLITYGDTISDGVNGEGPARPPLVVLKQFADEQLQSSFSSIHVLPFFPYSSDDGFAVVDYSTVREDLGNWQDITRIGEHFKLMFDLVINHCSREHIWFADFINDREPGREFFIELPATTDVSAVVRPRNTPLLSLIHTYNGPKHVWTTFSDDQIDLNFEHFEVLYRFTEILFDYVRRGASMIRLDAIAFLWKRLGTHCMSLPETHMVVKIMRLLLDYSGTGVLLLTETNVPHEENVSYFGHGDEAHLVYQFSLAPLLLYSYLFNDGSYLQQWAQNLTAPPAGCTYLNFIASHDGIGLRPLEHLVPDQAVTELVTLIHRRGGFVSMRTGPNGEQRAYEMNIALFSAFGGDAHAIPAYVGAHQLLLAFQGVPAIYLPALLGTTNDLHEVERTGRTRSINRGQLQYAQLKRELANPEDIKTQVFTHLKRSLQIRKAQAAFAPGAHQLILNGSAQLFALLRRGGGQTIVVLASFSDFEQQVELHELEIRGHTGTPPRTLLDLLTGTLYKSSMPLILAAYQVVWLELDADSEADH